MFTGFATQRIDVDGVGIQVCHGGIGPPVLLLHGYPQTHVMWHRVAPRMAERFHVVCPDLRGYGDSDKPSGGADHVGYAKRTMAREQLQVMRALGYQRFAVAGHDRGARVALRMALDAPEVVSALALADIVPTDTIYDTLDRDHALAVWRYAFLTQPSDLPERMIAADPRWYLRRTLDEWCATPGALTEAAVSEYLRCFDTASIHATCEDYRAGASVDLEHDAAGSRTVRCPVLVLFSALGLGRQYDVEAIWRRRAADVRLRDLDCGHFLAEERPHDVAAELIEFFGIAQPQPSHAD
jgi:haloacetate dehalogenase